MELPVFCSRRNRFLGRLRGSVAVRSARIVGNSETAHAIGLAARHTWLARVYRSKTFLGLPPSLPFALEAAFLARLLDWPPI